MLLTCYSIFESESMLVLFYALILEKIDLVLYSSDHFSVVKKINKNDRTASDDVRGSRK